MAIAEKLIGISLKNYKFRTFSRVQKPIVPE
jgi:hypothetical protein